MALTPAEVLHTWFERVWNQADESAIDELLHPTAIAHGLTKADGSEVRGLPGHWARSPLLPAVADSHRLFRHVENGLRLKPVLRTKSSRLATGMP